MLHSLYVTIKSDIKYKNIRNPDTRQMSNVFIGNIFLYVAPRPNNKSLLRVVTCANLNRRLYHHDQVVGDPKLQYYNCWEHGHRKQQCKNYKAWRVCKEPVHAPVTPKCQYYEDSPKNVVAFQGEENPLSIFFPCDLYAFGEHHKPDEHAYQHTRALLCNNPSVAQKNKESGDRPWCEEDWSNIN